MTFNIQKIDTFTGHKDCVYTLEHANNEDEFYSAGADGMVILWSIKKPDLGTVIAKTSNSIYAIHNIATENQLWIGNNYEGVHLIDTLTNQQTGSIPLGKKSFFDIRGHSNQLFVLDNSGMVNVINKHEMSQQKHIYASKKNSRTMAINLDKNEFAVGYSDHTIKIFDLKSLDLKKVLEGHKNSVFSLKYINNNQTLLSTGRDAHILAWDVNLDYELKNDVPAHLYAINDLVYIEKHHLIASCSMDKSIKLWDAETLKLLKVIDKARFAGHGTSINKLLWLESSETLLSASDDRTISMWKLF